MAGTAGDRRDQRDLFCQIQKGTHKVGYGVIRNHRRWIVQSIMENSRKSNVESFKNRLRLEIKPIIERGKKTKPPRKVSDGSEAYQPNFFQELESGRIQILGKFEQMFEETDKLGEGVQSVVKKVIEKSTGKVFAVKTFKTNDAEMISRITQVYLLLRTLDFPTVTKPYYLFISGKTNTARVVMDYVQYPTLEKLVKEYHSFSQEYTRNVMKILLQTVAYLHSKKVCHRDIKPANILYDPEACDEHRGLRLIDYEICKFSKKDYIEMWTVTGSLFYKAPEMFKGSYDQKIDVWGCGIICYQLLHGRTPFAHQFINETIEQICSDPIDDKLDSDLDPFAKDFIRKCLKKNPRQRLSASEALKQPFILQAATSPVTPRDSKLNSSFQLQTNRFTLQRASSTGKQGKSRTKSNECIIKDQLWD